MTISRRSLAAAVLLLLLAYALRLYRLDGQSLWWDEGISLHLATSSLGDIVRDRLANIHPPLYFFLLKGWLALVGVSPFTGRYLSALAGLLSVALVFAIVRQHLTGVGRGISRAAPWLAAALMLLSPLSVIYSQEIRVYALLPVVYLIMLLLAGRWLADKRRPSSPASEDANSTIAPRATRHAPPATPPASEDADSAIAPPATRHAPPATPPASEDADSTIAPRATRHPPPATSTASEDANSTIAPRATRHAPPATPPASEDADSAIAPPATRHPPLAIRHSPLAPLLFVTWLALHLHYIALFAVATVGAWGVFVLWRRRDWSELRRWLLGFALVGVAGLPWLLAVATNWSAVRAEAAAGTFTTQPVPLPFLFAQVWVFHLTGLAGALGSAFVRVGADVAAVTGGVLLAAVAAAWLRGRRDGRPAQGTGDILRLAAFWALPLLGGLLVWSVRSFSHPRYIVMFAALLVPLAALLIVTARGWRRAVAVLFGVGLVALSLWGLRQYFFDPATAKPDVRGVALLLEQTAAPDDLILIPDTDWSLPFEFRGATPVVMPAVAESPHDPDGALVQALGCVGDAPCARSGRVFVLDYLRGTRDWQSRLPFELARRGHRVATTDFGDVVVHEYRLDDRAGPLPACDAPDVAQPLVRFGPPALMGVWVDQGAASDTAVAVALCWQLADEAAADAVASLVLRDPLTGERLAQADTPLLNRDGAPVGRWLTGATVVTYHVLPLVPGTPPLAASLSLGVYEGGAEVELLEARDTNGAPLGRLLSLGDVSLAAPVGLAVSPYGVAGPALLSEPPPAMHGLRLVGFSSPPGPFRPGQTIRVGLTWQAEEELGDARPSLALELGGAAPAVNDDAPAQGRYPIDRWAAGEMVTEVRDVRVPAAAEGAAELVVRVNGQRLAAAPVMISGAAARMEPPPVGIGVAATFGEAIRLIGFDPPPATLDATRPVTVTLHWQALSGEIPTGYTVFVHLLADDGRLIAQHDGPPAAGARPTNEWLEGEYVSDTHELTWREVGYSGPARLAVGLYDPLTGARLPTSEGDLFLLPGTFTVTP